MHYLELNKLKSEFETEVWIPLYDAMELYFWKYDSGYYCYDDNSATILDEWLVKVIQELKSLCLQKTNSKEMLEAKHIKNFAKMSDEKCLHPEKARYSSRYTELKPFLNIDLIKQHLCENPTIARNPYWILNHPDDDAVLIFQPSKRLIDQYGFIKKRYSWDSRVVVYYYVSMDELKQYRSGDIIVEPEDILELNLRYLSPYQWWLIQSSSDFSLLIS